jgi:hypothetical protein
MAVFWVVVPFSVLKVYQLIALMIEAASTSDKLVNFYQTTQHYNPKDSHLHTRRRENLKYIAYMCIRPIWAKITLFPIILSVDSQSQI